MANLTIYEFEQQPDAAGNPPLPGIQGSPQTATTPATVALNDKTVFVLICSDQDCRMGINAAPGTSGIPILSAVENAKRLMPGKGRTLQFV